VVRLSQQPSQPPRARSRSASARTRPLCAPSFKRKTSGSVDLALIFTINTTETTTTTTTTTTTPTTEIKTPHTHCFYRVPPTHRHPLTEIDKSSRPELVASTYMHTPPSVSRWASEVVSVGIVMKGAQSDAKNGYEANSVVSGFEALLGGVSAWCRFS
jgi:hypothetical protein